MAANELLVKRIREKLSQRDDVEEKTMFRGMTFMVDGKMCINVARDEAMFRIDPEKQAELVAAKECSVMRMKGRAYNGYLLVSENNLIHNEDLEFWISEALAYNKTAKSSKRKAK